MTTKNMYKKQNAAVNLYTEKEGDVSDINELPNLTEIGEFEDWLDSVNKYNDLLD